MLICNVTLSGPLCAQAAAKSGATASSSAGQGFSIESEMLTYRALQSNSEAVACDIAAYLYRQPWGFTKAARGSSCGVKANGNAGVILLPFDQGVIEALQLWRADLAIMDELRQRALEHDCPAIEVKERGSATSAAASAAIGTTPVGAALDLAQTAFGMVATQAEVAPVIGTIQDQAFLNGVSRQLRMIGVSVLMPESYRPFTLNGLDPTKSPFLTSLRTFLASHDCMQSKDDGKEKGITEIVSEMNAFLATLNGIVAPVARSGPSSGIVGSGNGSSGGSGSTTSGISSPQPVTNSSPSNLTTILLADGLAQKLGVDAATGKLADNGDWQHILFLKALESGGTISRNTNIFGTRIRYSGGAVGTYSLMTLQGDVECSGNVFDFGGSVKAKDFEKELRRYASDPASQLIFQGGGGCSQLKH